MGKPRKSNRSKGAKRKVVRPARSKPTQSDSRATPTIELNPSTPTESRETHGSYRSGPISDAFHSNGNEDVTTLAARSKDEIDMEALTQKFPGLCITREHSGLMIFTNFDGSAPASASTSASQREQMRELTQMIKTALKIRGPLADSFPAAEENGHEQPQEGRYRITEIKDSDDETDDEEEEEEEEDGDDDSLFVSAASDILNPAEVIKPKACATAFQSLDRYIRGLFEDAAPHERRTLASYAWERIWHAVVSQSFLLPAEVFAPEELITWDYWQNVLGFVMVLAAPREEAGSILKWCQSDATVAEIEAARKIDMRDRWSGLVKGRRNAYAELQNAARGKNLKGWAGMELFRSLRKLERKEEKLGIREAWIWAMFDMMVERKTTVIGVKIVDVSLLKFAEGGFDLTENYESFEHGCVFCVGPEGVRMWQGWGRVGRKVDGWVGDEVDLEQWIRGGGAQLGTVEEGFRRIEAIEDFVRLRGQRWDDGRYLAYKLAFNIDLKELCGERKRRKPMFPYFDAWVDIRMLRNFKIEHICKFEFESDSDLESVSQEASGSEESRGEEETGGREDDVVEGAEVEHKSANVDGTELSLE